MAQPPDESATLDRDDDEDDEDLDRAYRRQVARNLQSLAAWLDEGSDYHWNRIVR